MADGNGNGQKTLSDVKLNSYRVDLNTQTVQHEVITCEDWEDFFGGMARGYKLLADRVVDNPYDPAATLLMNLGVLTGSDVMTGLRTYFQAYSPLKRSSTGKPSAMWSTGSGKFGPKLRYLGIDEVIFTGRLEKPSYLHLTKDADGVKFRFKDAAHLLGKLANDKIQALHKDYPEAHFAVIGPAGENYGEVYYASVALSTENQLKSGDNKPRFAGRGGMGGVMGSKNLVAIVADIEDPPAQKQPPAMKDLNMEIARGKGSSRFRDKKKNGAGGTWANYEALNPAHAMPEMNFVPTGTVVSLPLYRDNFEQGPYTVKDESCFRCGISCHKNVYDEVDGKAGKFRAKLDFEPLNLLASNIGIFDPDEACELIELVDYYCMDSISIGTTLSYVMEYNRRNPEKTIADGLKYGDYQGTHDVVVQIGTGKLPQLGRGLLRLAEDLGEMGYAMQCKGIEFAAYLPQHNPGYPWALAGSHMSMKTYLLCINEKETSMDYWVDAITNRGLLILRDDFTGVCKFNGLPNDLMAQALEAITGVTVTENDLETMIRRTFLRGYQLEKVQGFTDEDYNMPDEVHDEYPQIELPYFNTKEFFTELRGKVQARFNEMLVEEGLN